MPPSRARLEPAGAAELADMLTFMGQWLTRRTQLAISFDRFLGTGRLRPHRAAHRPGPLQLPARPRRRRTTLSVAATSGHGPAVVVYDDAQTRPGPRGNSGAAVTGKARQDQWAAWLGERRHGGDPEQLRRQLEFLAPIRSQTRPTNWDTATPGSPGTRAPAGLATSSVGQATATAAVAGHRPPRMVPGQPPGTLAERR
jgi:hypothetical protein